jgi:DNA-binding LytR/AlgR family response regulator
MKCAIIEDDPIADAHLKKLIEDNPNLDLIDSYTSGESAIEGINSHQPELLFLDMRIGNQNGFDILKKINKLPQIIITSAYNEYAVEAFNKNVQDYLLKPIEVDRFHLAINKLINKKRNYPTNEIKPKIKTPDYIFVRCNSLLNKIKLSEIKYIQAAGDYVNIYTKQKRYTVHITLRAMEEKLPANKFYRLHRSYVVALDQVDFIEEGTAYLEKHPIPIGEQFKKELLKKLNLI